MLLTTHQQFEEIVLRNKRAALSQSGRLWPIKNDFLLVNARLLFIAVNDERLGSLHEWDDVKINSFYLAGAAPTASTAAKIKWKKKLNFDQIPSIKF